MTKTPDLIMLGFDSFVQGREVQVKENAEVLENFVVLEGLDGSGTTTQLEMVREKLEGLGIPHCCTGEPTRGPVGRIIRQILERRIQARPESVALLFAADRNEHLYEQEEGILAHLARGELVISDRYLFSSLAYQSVVCDPDFVFGLNCRFPLPAHVVFLDTPPAVSQARLSTRSPEAPELYDGEEIQQAIRDSYERGFGRFCASGMQLHKLDASAEAAVVFEKFWSLLAGLPIVKA